MINENILKTIIIVCISVALALLGTLITINLKSKDTIKKVRRHKLRRFDSIYQKLYIIFSKNILTKRYIYDIRSRLEIIEDYTENILRKKVVKIFLIIILVLITLLFSFIILSKQLYLICMFVVAIWFLGESIIDFFVIRLKNNLLKQQIKFNELVRHKYYETKMVDESIYLACEELDKEYKSIGIQGEKIYDVLMSKDVEKEILKYNEVAPNKFLKMFLGLAYITKEYGDTIIDGNSVFMKNINHLSNEIRIEKTKRDKLNYALKSLNIIVLLPLFFISPIKTWAGKNFIPLKTFYESNYGFLLEMIMLGIIFASFLGIRKVQQFEDKKIYLYKKKTLVETIYNRYLYKLIDKIVAKRGHRKKHKIKMKLKESASYLTIEGLYTKKLIMLTCSLIISISFVIIMHNITINNVLNKPTIPDGFLGGQLSDEEMIKAKEVTKIDRKIIESINRNSKLKDIEKILKENYTYSEEAIKIMANRIYNKRLIINNQYIKWWEILICLAISILFYNLPNIALSFQKEIRKIDMEDEVSGFQTIILMLMHHPRISIEDILEWLELFSFTFKEPLQDCINNCSLGLNEALIILREEVRFESFNKIIDNLIMASEDLSIRQAFDELETEKNYHNEQRKTTNEKIVQRKISIGQIIGFTPVYSLILIYMILPMITSSIKEMNMYFNNIL